MDRKKHWENVYISKPLNSVSWYQPTPSTSLDIIDELGIPQNASIIDVGGGDSFLADCLLEKGFTDITVLDISEAAINRAKKRLGDRAGLINWVVSDITEYQPEKKFDCWHDRAAFHFLTKEEEVNHYLVLANRSLTETGRLILGTFSDSGPEKCSGLPVKQYSERSLTNLINRWFEKIKCIQTQHLTPFNSIQDFLFCSFKKTKISVHGYS